MFVFIYYAFIFLQTDKFWRKTDLYFEKKNKQLSLITETTPTQPLFPFKEVLLTNQELLWKFYFESDGSKTLPVYIIVIST